MTPQVPAYTPSIYGPGSTGRFRPYPRVVRTRIPGAGYHVPQLAWAEQEINLSGGRRHRGGPEPLRGIGNYDSGDGMGDTASDAMGVATVAAQLIRDPEGTLRVQGPRIVTAIDRHILTPIVDQVFEDAKPHLLKYLGPPFLVMYLMTGLSTYYSYLVLKDSRRGVAKNGRKRRRRRSSRR
jgi:hypothetical protein